MIARVTRIVVLLTAVVAALLAFAGAANADRTATPRIVGGVQSPRAWPAQGLLQLQIGSDFFDCGGTLISGRWFLTAAHCVSEEPPSTTVLPPSAFHVRLGSANRNLGMSFTVDAVERFEPYSLNKRNDVALLELSTAPSPTNPAIQPLRLVSATESGLWSPGTLAAIIGWGTTTFCPNGCAGPTNLREAGVPIVTDAACTSAYGSDFNAATMVCAGNGITDTCQGDSGGPLMVPRVDAWVLAAVTSWGLGCAEPGFPGVYARIGAPALNAWIRDRVPALTISSDALTTQPDVGSDVDLTATSTPGQHLDDPEFNWDTNNDGAFDDDTGDTITLTDISVGSHVVKVQRIYADGDRAVAREVITTSGSTPPGPPAPAPIVSPPPPPPAVIPPPPGPPPPPPAPTEPLAKLVSIPKTIKVKDLLDRRMTIRVQCTDGCFVESTMKLDAKTSRKVHLTNKKRSVRIASGDGELLSAGTLKVTLRLSRRTVKRLRNARRGRLTLRVVATGDDENSTQLTAKIKLRR